MKNIFSYLSPKFKYLESGLFILFFAWISFFPEPLHQRYAFYAGACLFLFLGIILLNAENRKDLFSLKDWPLWLFLLSILPGQLNAIDKSASFKTYLLFSTNLFLVYYVGKVLGKSGKNIDKLNIIICVSSILVSLLGFFEVIYGFNPIYKYLINNPYYQRYIEFPVRPMSTLFNPAPLATYLLFTWPFAIPLCRHKNPLGYITIVTNIVCLILTFSRGSFLGLIFMLLCYLFLSKRYKDLLILGSVLLAMLTALEFLPYPFSRFSFFGISIHGTGIFSDYRLIRTQMSLKMLDTHPLFGVGLSNFRTLFDNFYPVKAQLQYIGYETKIPDNMYFSLLAETGIVGFSGFLIFVFSLVYRGLKKFKNDKNDKKKQSFTIYICILTGILCSMGGYELFYWSTPYILFCLTCGLINADS